MTINRSPSLTEQVKAHIKERIVGGEFTEGRIPSETVLASALGVSRTTVRDALSRLENEGAVVRRQGAGTFVNESILQIRSRLEAIWSYEDVLQAHGYTPAVRVLAVEEEAAAEWLAADLFLTAGEPIVVIEKLFLEDRRPVVLTYNRISAGIVPGPVGETDAATPIYEYLEAAGGRHLSYYLSEIVPVVLQDDLAAKLDVVEGTPAISFREVGFDDDNRPLVQATSYFRDDLLRFRLMRRKDGS